MRIILTMVGVALGIAIAVVAGVYGWQQYQDTLPVNLPPVASAPAPAVPAAATLPASQPIDTKPKPVVLPQAKPAPTAPVASLPPAPPRPTPTHTEPAPAQPSGTMKPAPSAGPAPATPPSPAPAPSTTAPAPGEDTPIAVAETPDVATAEKLNQLVMGMTEADVATAMGKDGVVTPDAQMSAYTPEGWYEVRWPNADGSYIAALFNDQGALVHLEPFNLAGADEWMTTPFYVLPNWLNEKLRANNMPVRLPAVDVVATQADTFQFGGPLVNADGQIAGNISGTYYVNDPNGQFARAMEGTYEYTLADGSVDSNTFQFSE